MSTNQNPDPASEEARRINAAAAAVDCRLEVALEGVLIRYGIPAYLEVACGADRPHVLRENADRGDLSSDLATVAREAPPTVDPEPYERTLAELYVQVMKVYDAHPEHLIGPFAPPESCPTCGASAVRPDDDERCGGPAPEGQCDELGLALWDVLDAAFPPEDAERWLRAWPAADFLEWGNDGSGASGDGSLRAYLADTVRHDAMTRILGGLRPTDPRTTRPKETTDNG